VGQEGFVVVVAASKIIQFPIPNAPAGTTRKTLARDEPQRFISDSDVDTFKEYMKRTHQGRDRDYHVLVNAYHGNFYRNTDQNWNLDGAGHLLLRSSDKDDAAAPTVVNLLKGFVDDYTAPLSELPAIQTPTVRTQFADDAAMYEWKERVERVGYGIWAASSMEMRQIEAAWWLPTCGMFGAMVLPDFQRGHAVIEFVAPWSCYGIRKQGDPFSLSRFMVIAHEDPYVLQDRFGKDWVPDDAFANLVQDKAEGKSDPTELRGIEHIIYLDEEWFIRRIGDKTQARVFHGLGFCPGIMSQFIMLPDYTRGHSAIEQAVPAQLSMNYAVSMWDEALQDEIFRTIYVVDPQNVPDNFQRGKSQVITVNPGGAVGEFGGASGALKTVAGHVELLQRLMEHNTGSTRVRTEGRMASGGPTTGRGIEQVQGPQRERISTIQKIQGFYMSKLLKYAALMTADHKLWESTPDEVVGFTGQMKGVHFGEKMTRAELGRCDFELQYSPLAGLSLLERVNIGLQLYHADPPLISWYDMAELHNLVRDVPELRRRIEEDIKWRVENKAKEAKAINAGAAPEEPGVNPMDTAASLNAGATNKETLARAGAGGGPPPTAAGAAAAVGAGGTAASPLATEAAGPPAGAMEAALREPPAEPRQAPSSGLEVARTTAQEVTAAIQSVPNLRAEVYVSGDTVLCLDWRDVRYVKAAIKHLKGVTVKAAGKKLPDDATLVGGGGPNAART
jgi:hypothetical protein